MRLGNLYNLCSYQSPYPPVADKPESTPRHSGLPAAGRVVDLSHSRPGGNGNQTAAVKITGDGDDCPAQPARIHVMPQSPT